MMEKYAEDLENKVAKKTMQVLGRLKKLVPNRTIQLHKHTPKWSLKRWACDVISLCGMTLWPPPQLQNEKQKAHYKISRFLPRAVLDKIENGLETEPYTDKEVLK